MKRIRETERRWKPIVSHMVSSRSNNQTKKAFDLHQVSGRRAARYIFVGGLHRSGTTLIADLIASADGVGAIAGAPVPEQEGVYLQGAIPHDARSGIPGSFAFDPAAHLTEDSSYNRLEVARRMAAEWDPWFPPDAKLRVEKSPVNLLRSRLYQCLFPTAMFVFVVRHPVAVARATAKWSDRSEAERVDHWEHAHALLASDLAHLHNYVIVRYEDLAADPVRELARIAALIGTTVPVPAAPIENRNAAYAGAPVSVGPVAASFGYGPDLSVPTTPRIAGGHHYFRSATDQLRFADEAT
jgi:hypothetical protein